MAPQRHNIPLDILPGFLPQRQPLKLSSLFGSDVVDYLQINLESNGSRIETQPKELVKKIRFDDSKIDFNPDPFRRRSILVRRNEWARLTENCLMPELPRRLDERQLDSRIERPILPNLGGVIDKSDHFPVRFKNAIPPTLKSKVTSINAGKWFDARSIRNNIVINVPEPKIDPVSSIISNSRLDSSFEIDVSANHSVSHPIMQDVVLRSRKPWKPTQLLYWKDVSVEETVSISEISHQNRRGCSESNSELLKLKSICQVENSSKMDSSNVGAELIDKLTFTEIVPQSRIEKPVLMQRNFQPVANQISYLTLKPESLHVSIPGLKSLCRETYNTWFVQINRTGLRPRFQYPSIHPLTYADWKLIDITTVSLPSSLRIMSYRDYVHDVFEILYDITKPGSDSNYLNSLSFKPICLTIDHEAIIRPRVREFELSSPVISGLVESQAPTQGCHSADDLSNLNLLIERNQITRDGEAHVQEDYFFDGLSSEEDRSPPHTFKTIQHSQVRVSNNSNEGIDDAPNVKPDTPSEKSIGQKSSETIDLTVRNEHEKPQGQIESSSLTDEQLIAHMEMLESSLTDEQLIAHMEMLERKHVFGHI